jgi:DNA ligase-1
MKHILEYIEEITNTSSRKEKESLLEAIRLNKEIRPEFEAIFTWTYSPTIDFYIKDLKDLPEGIYNPQYDMSSTQNAHHYTELFERLSKRKVTGNEAKQLISDFLASNDTMTQELIKRVVKRDLRAGISAKTINKVFTDLIYVHPYMRCDTLNDKTIKGLSYPCISQVKLDGMYVDIVVNDGKVTYMSRKGSILPFNDTQRDEKLLEFADNQVIQCEALVDSDDTVEGILNRASGNGYLNSDDIDVSKIRFVAWDIIPYDDFIKGKCDIVYVQRFSKIEKICYLVGDFLELVDTVDCHRMEHIVDHFKEVRSFGLEGTVVKNYAGAWKDGTSKNQLKVKVVAECDLAIVGFNGGEGKNEGLIGSLVCQTSDGLVEVSVSGFTDAVRSELTNNINELIENKTIITVKFNDILKNENTDTLSLFLPRYVRTRFDKTEADTLEDIKKILDSFEFSQ